MSYKKADHFYVFNSLRDCINHRQGILKTQEHLSWCLPTLLYPHFTEKWWRLEWLVAFLKLIKVKIVVQTPLWPKRLFMHGLPAHFSDAGHIGCFLYSLLKLRLPQVFVLSVLPASYLMRADTCSTESQLNYHNPGSLSVHRITVQYFPLSPITFITWSWLILLAYLLISNILMVYSSLALI